MLPSISANWNRYSRSIASAGVVVGGLRQPEIRLRAENWPVQTKFVFVVVQLAGTLAGAQ